MKKLILHIGNAKTGTTAIQKYCHLYQKELREDGFLYCSVGRDFYDVNHKAFHFSFLKELGRSFRNHDGAEICSLKSYISDICSEVEESDASVFLISFEGLASLAIHGEYSARLLRYFKDSLEKICDIEVVVYVRDPWDSLVSNYNERCKTKNRLFDVSCGFGLIEQASHRTADQVDHRDEVGLISVTTGT